MWTRQGIHCPGGLLDAQEGLQPEIKPDPELEDNERQPTEMRALPGSRRHKKASNVNEALANFQLAVLMELGRQTLADEAIGRLPPQVRIPAEMVREAYQSGARGKELALWVAAAAATAAVAVRFGPSAAGVIPRLIGPRTSGTAGIGFRFQAPVFTKASIKKRVAGFIGSVSRVGHDFSGTEG